MKIVDDDRGGQSCASRANRMTEVETLHRWARAAKSAGALDGSTRDFLMTPARNPLTRAEAFWEWNSKRIFHGAFPFGKALASAPAATASLRYLDGRVHSGINFSSQEYLSLASHPREIGRAHV